MSKLYFSGSTHHLSKEEAFRYVGSMYRHKQEADGTWSVYHLVDKPVQHGQTEWKD